MATKIDIVIAAREQISALAVKNEDQIPFMLMAVEGMNRHPYMSRDWTAHNSMYATAFNLLVDGGANSEALATAVSLASVQYDCVPNSK